MNTLSILLLAFFNIWGRKSFPTAPIPNNREQKSSSVAQNNSISKYRKCSGKRSVLTTYCCIHLHLSQCVLLIVKKLIQILLIIGGVEQNPGPGHIVSVDRDEHRTSGVVANNACRDALSNAEHNEITRTSNNIEMTTYELAARMSRNSRLNNVEQEFNYTEEYSYRPERISVNPYSTNNYDEFDQHGTEPIYTRSQMPIQNIPVTNINAQQYSNDPRLLSEVEQLRAELRNCKQIMASYQHLPPKAPAHFTSEMLTA